MGEPLAVGRKIIEIGEQIRQEGSFPGGHYIHEASLEIDDSIALLRKAMEQETCHEFSKLVQRAAKQAEAGYGSLGCWGPRLAGLRWLCCVWWLAARADIVNKCSAGACFGTLYPKDSEGACERAKESMFQWMSSLLYEAAVLKVFDFDLLGFGVFMNKRAEPLPRGGNNEWFRRQLQCDLASLCRQVKDLPPESLNLHQPKLNILRPYGELTWMLPPTEALRCIVEKHAWAAETFMPPIDEMPAKPLIQGPVLHMDSPPPIEWDMTDPEIIAKLQRGDNLGKGSQEDGLPGAIHGSVGLLFAGIVGVEKIVNVKIYPTLLEVDDFLECFLKYCTPLESLDLAEAEGCMDEELLTFLPYAGPNLRVLDLSRCNLDGSQVETLVDTVAKLTGLQHLDLAHNALDAPSATMLLAALAERRVDLQTIRLDGNPLGDMHEFRQDVAGLLAARGDQVVAGGELVLHLNLDAVRWFPEPRPDTLAARRRDDTLMMAATSFEELTHGANSRNAALDKVFREKKDPRTRTIVGRGMLAEERHLNERVLTDKMLTMYHTKVVNVNTVVGDAEKKR